MVKPITKRQFRSAKKVLALFISIALLVTTLQGLTFTVLAYDIGNSFKIYSNPVSTLNTNGRSYFYGTSNQAILENTSSTRTITKYFNLGDGIIHEPTSDSLKGLNTKITIGHCVTSGSSDLVAEVVYIENGIKKFSLPYGFTGYHADGRQVGTNNAQQTFDIGTYPNVVAVNVFHTMQEKAGLNSVSVPAHDYVQFDVVSEAGSVVLPATQYYIERRTVSNYFKGKELGVPAPVAASPKPGAEMVPFVAPTPKTDSAVVALGLGATFTLFSSNYDGLTLSEGSPYHLTDGDKGVADSSGNFVTGPYTLTDTAKFMNLNRGISTVNVGSGGLLKRSQAGACYGRTCVLIDRPNLSTVEYKPTPGLLNGVETKISIPFDPNHGDGVLSAVVTYDGGKKATVVICDPKSPAETPKAFKIRNGGSYKNLESVSLLMTGGGYWFVPECIFTVVNENAGKLAPVSPERTYQKPDVPQASPKPVSSSAPVLQPNTVSPLSINEVCSDNTNGYKDSKGVCYDWVEIFNNSDSDINIQGYQLTDNATRLNKWTFPSAVVPAKGFLVVFASGLNVVDNGDIHTNFSVSNDGEPIILSDPSGGIISVMDLPKMEENQSLSRVENGSNNLKITVPTPNTSNILDAVISSYVPKPVFSAESGFYKDNFNLSITSPSLTVYYTLDGSVPTTASTQLTAPMPIYNRSGENNVISAITYNTCSFAPTVKVDKCMVVNAIAVDEGGNCSDVVSKTYFVGLNIQSSYNNAAVISVSTDQKELFDSGYGIFTNSQQRGRLWERKVHMNFFEGDGSLAMDQDCGLSVRGNGARSDAQKSLTFSARGDYGKSTFDHKIWNESTSKVDGSVIDSYKSFVLRAAVFRTGGARYMDPSMQHLSKTLDTAWQSGRIAVLFINGEFWGQYYLEEKVSTDYIEEHYGVPEENVLLFKTSAPKGETTYYDLNLLNAEKAWLTSTDFSIQENYDQLAAKYDLPQMMRYYAVNLSVANRDWGAYNFGLWRSRYITDKPYEDGKWRFMLYDLDGCYQSPGDDALFSMLNDAFTTAIQKNASLKRRFVNAICDVYSGWYNTGTVYNEMHYWQGDLEFFAKSMKDRWDYNISNADVGWYNNVTARAPYYIKYLRQQFGLTGEYTNLNVKVNDHRMGNVVVNDIPADLSNNSYTGWYFNDFTTTLVAQPKDGYKFVGWEKSDGTTLTSDTDTTTFVSIPANGSVVTAKFTPIDDNTLGTADNPIKIASAVDLESMANSANANAVNAGKYYMLTNDIVLSGTNNHTPIGTKAIPFIGCFNGNNHTISGINISTTTQGSGLFGYVGAGGEVKNVGVINVSITATGTDGKNVGGIAGNNIGIIENCYSTGSLSGISTVGGIVGNNTADVANNMEGAVRNCYSVATISGDSIITLGGITGKTELNAKVINSYSLIAPVAKRSDEGSVDSLTSVKTAGQFADGTVTNLLNENGTWKTWKSGDVAPVLNTDTNLLLSYTSGKVTVENDITLNNTKLMVASYDGQKLLDILIYQVTADPYSKTEFVIPADFKTVDGGQVKLMLWNGTDIIAPLTDATTVTIIPAPSPTPSPSPTPTPSPTSIPSPSPRPSVSPSASPTPTPSAPSDGNIKEVTTFAELKSAITTQESGESAANPTRIIIKADIKVTEELYLDYRNKVLLSDGDHTITRGNGYTGNMFKIKSNGSLDIGGVDGYGVLTFDGGALTDPSSSNAMFFYDGDNIVSNIYSGIFQNVRSNEGQGVFRLNYGDTTLNIGSVTFKDLSTVGAGGAMFIANRAVVTIDGATFANCVSNGDAGAIEAVNQYGAAPTIVINDGLFENCTAGAGGGAIYQKDGSSLTVNGGIFRNCTATNVGGAISSWWLPSTVTINGGEFINCTGTNYGGAVHNMNGILNINGGKFDSNSNTAIFSEGGDGTLTLLGGNFTNNNYSVNHKGKTFDIGGSVKMDAGSLIRLDGSNKINIVSNLSTAGAVANVEMKGNGTVVLTGTTPDLLANNYTKFGMKYGNQVCGVNASGQVDSTTQAPEFLPFAESMGSFNGFSFTKANDNSLFEFLFGLRLT